ncbi:MAG TPA: DUF1080 domain-containing protein [Pirellulales bacterium]|jgi:hypothetical protein|nr:DUF1080 domain-containing protein [Pirellulales bacterium]
MSRRFVVLTSCVAVLFSVLAYAANEYVSGKKWPEPKVVQPGEGMNPPADAIVLFDGKDLSKWSDGDKWIVADGVATAAKTSIHTKQKFGDCQLHLEWATPEKVSGNGQGRGNSGVYIQEHYEIQILDSFNNPTYFDGQAASVYKQRPPLVNVCRKPGEWQSYDIIFTAPKFDKAGKVEKPAYVTVLQNNVLVQNHTEIEGTTSYDHAPEYNAHAAKETLQLQFHGNPVRFRNIWIREL